MTLHEINEILGICCCRARNNIYTMPCLMAKKGMALKLGLQCAGLITRDELQVQEVRTKCDADELVVNMPWKLVKFIVDDLQVLSQVSKMTPLAKHSKNLTVSRRARCRPWTDRWLDIARFLGASGRSCASSFLHRLASGDPLPESVSSELLAGLSFLKILWRGGIGYDYIRKYSMDGNPHSPTGYSVANHDVGMS